jgi:putative transport protein
MVGAGQKYNLLALVGCLAGLAVALLLGHIFGIKIGHTLGLYAGSMTSTATLQAALDVMKNKDPSIGYSIAYPFGVIGPILCIYFMTRIVKPKFPAKTQRFHMGEISIGQGFAGRRLSELTTEALGDLQVTMIRKDGRNFVPTPDTVLSAGDGVLVVAERQEAIAKAAAQLGRLEPGRLASDRADLDYIRVFVGKANVVGVPLADLPMPVGYPTHLLHVRRSCWNSATGSECWRLPIERKRSDATSATRSRRRRSSVMSRLGSEWSLASFLDLFRFPFQVWAS